MTLIFPRGIDPNLLVSQVKNTMPYLWDERRVHLGWERTTPGLRPMDVILRQVENPERSLTHVEYFELCLSAHYLSCATPVPTDVDRQIRFKLWPENLPEEMALEMTQIVLDSRHWDFTKTSRRHLFGATESPWEHQGLFGHLGEWFTVSTAAYCALRRSAQNTTQSKSRLEAAQEQLFQAISCEVETEAQIFGSLWRARDGIGCLKASALIAHNLGDLNRVMQMWELPQDDPLYREHGELTSKPFDSHGKLRHQGRLWAAGELYKAPIEGSSMASENHRHFALRKPRILREHPDFLIPLGPFFDDWGHTLSAALGRLSADPKQALDGAGSVIEALGLGLVKLPGTWGYARALRALLEAFPQAASTLPPTLNSHPQWKKTKKTPQDRFESLWAQAALTHLEEIPSKAR
ncbi:MAG: hypothetical protein ACO3A2_08080 [Bdellovibrionia bacterium]